MEDWKEVSVTFLLGWEGRGGKESLFEYQAIFIKKKLWLHIWVVQCYSQGEGGQSPLWWDFGRCPARGHHGVQQGGGHRPLGRGHPLRRHPLLCPLQALQGHRPVSSWQVILTSGQCNFQDPDTKYETSRKTEKVESPREESEQNPVKPKCARNLEVTCNNSNKLAGRGKYIYTNYYLRQELFMLVTMHHYRSETPKSCFFFTQSNATVRVTIVTLNH